MRIGIFGSAFDPPHKGHIAAIQSAKKALELDRVILIPTKIPPHKDRPKTPERFRLHMARLVAKGRKGWVVSDMEFKRPGRSYTRDTIASLKKRYPGNTLFWIVGSDSLVSMPWKWKGGWEVLDLCTFVVIPRSGYSLGSVPKVMLQKVIVLKRTPHWVRSSTTIRNLLQHKKSVRHLLDPSVLKFIQQHHLYADYGS